MGMITKWNDESFDDYFVRLFERKKDYGLTCEHIADLLNAESGESKGESAYRKEYAAFNRGRIYERSKQEGAVATRILSLSDFHYPFNVPVSTFSEYAGCVDVLVLNGDLVDMQAISKYTRTYRQSPMEEIIGCRQMLIDLIDLIKPAKVILTYGNHEARFEAYLAKNLDSDLLELMPSTPLDLIVNEGFRHYDKRNHSKIWYDPIIEVFPEIDIEYAGNWWARIGNVIFAHPKAYSTGMLKTTEKAINYFYRAEPDFTAIVLAHTHKLGSYVQGNVYMYEQGACCNTGSMTYSDGMLTLPQQSGFIYMCLDKDGNTIFDKTKLIKL